MEVQCIMQRPMVGRSDDRPIMLTIHYVESTYIVSGYNVTRASSLAAALAFAAAEAEQMVEPGGWRRA